MAIHLTRSGYGTQPRTTQRAARSLLPGVRLTARCGQPVFAAHAAPFFMRGFAAFLAVLAKPVPGFWAALLLSGAIAAKPSGADLGLDKEFFSSQKNVRVRDAIGKGRSREIAIQNARIDAHRKALERSVSSFRHMFVETKDFVLTNEQLIADVNAKVIEEARCNEPKWDHGMRFDPFHVAVMDCMVTVSFFDLDYFTTEIMKTAEGACIRSIVLSGWGQLYNKNYVTSAAMALITYGSIGYGYSREVKVAGARDEYNNAATPAEAEKKYKQMRDHQEVARTMYIIGALTWAYSIWEAFEDRERADDVLYQVHQKYFKGKLNYEPQISFFQRFMMQSTRPVW